MDRLSALHETRARQPSRPDLPLAFARMERAVFRREASAHGEGKRATHDTQSARQARNWAESAEEILNEAGISRDKWLNAR